MDYKKTRLAEFKKPWRIEGNFIVCANGSWIAALAGSCSREDDEILAQHICDCVNEKQ
jgi:hypothetical protein